jgi:hypothetical protein
MQYKMRRCAPSLFLALMLLPSCSSSTSMEAMIRQRRLQNETTACSGDQDCSDAQFCSAGSCRQNGTCSSLLDCQNPSNAYATILCLGFLQCDVDHQCSLNCSDTSCPNHDPVFCDLLPCEVTECKESHVSCVNDFCGGCHALFFNATGHQACAPNTTTADLKASCTNDTDCKGGGQFCSAGECREAGSCGSLLDCRNPSNIYPTIACVGYLECVDDQCGIQCSAEFCPNNDTVNCFAAPCDVTKCDEPYASCVDDTCGGCNALFFNSSGHQVCAPNTTTADLKASCTNDTDCKGDGQFCSAGECREAGSCGSLLDCRNPSNIYPTIECVGYLECLDDQCGIQCSAEFCPNNDTVNCFAAPCNVTKCEEPYVSCVEDYCGGCNALFFNSTGHPVCAPTTITGQETSCTNDTDCKGGDQFCSAGECREAGSCGSLLDCRNPSNIYPTILCVGYLECVDNQCGIQCSADVCPNNDTVNCFAAPCNVTKCDEAYVSCVEDYCGGCNALFFNSTGHQVCTTIVSSIAMSCRVSSDCNILLNQTCIEGQCGTYATVESSPVATSDAVDAPVASTSGAAPSPKVFQLAVLLLAGTISMW